MSFSDVKTYQARLSLLDQSIEKLRVVYEQFFMGIERFEPAQLRKNIQLELRELKENPPNNTALKFLLTRVETKFRTYEQYWNRVLREIEEGTYDRQVQRLKRKLREEGIPEELLANARTRGELEAALAQIAQLRAQQAIDRPKEDARPAASEAQPTGAGTDPRLRIAYENFVRARLSTGESLEGITPERFFATVSSQIPRAKQAHGCNDVEVQVVIKDNKATLRFLPR